MEKTSHTDSKDLDSQDIVMEQPGDDSQEHSVEQKMSNIGQLVGNIKLSEEGAGDGGAEVVDPKVLALHQAVTDEEVDKLVELSQKPDHPDFNIKFPSGIDPAHIGMTPLALTCALNKLKFTKVLLDHGADVNSTFASLKTTALMTASYHGHIDIVHELLLRGADVKAVDLQQSTALGYAFGGTRNIEVIRLLVNANVDVNQKNVLGMNALLLVAGYGDDELVSLILQAGADPNAVNDFGHSALHLAVVGKRDQLKKLKKAGSSEAAAADRSLNRRNLDMALREWAKLHKDVVGDGNDSMEELTKAGKLMMNIGQNMEDAEDNEDEDDQTTLQRRIAALMKHRENKIKAAKERNRSGVWNLLSCGGARSRQTDKLDSASKPLPAPEPPQNGPESQDRDDDPIVRSLVEKCTLIIRMLIDQGCHLNLEEKTYSMTALDLALLMGDMESTAVLVTAGGDPNHILQMLSSADLYQIIMTGNLKKLKDLGYDEDLDVNQPFNRFNLNSRNETDVGITPLTLAARQNQIEVMKKLIKLGAEVNAMGPDGRHPLAEAAAKGNRKIVEFLLNHNADVNKPSEAFDGANAAAVAAMMGHAAVVTLLLRKGAKIDLVSHNGSTALLRAFESRHREVLDAILNCDIEENISDRNGQTAKLAAMYQGSEKDVEAILNIGNEMVREHALQSSPESPHSVVSKDRTLGEISGLDMSSRDEEMDETVEEEKEGNIEVTKEEIKQQEEIVVKQDNETETADETVTSCQEEKPAVQDVTKEDINENYTKSVVTQSQVEVVVKTETTGNVPAEAKEPHDHHTGETKQEPKLTETDL